MNSSVYKKSFTYNNVKYEFETGHVALQTLASCYATAGETVCLATVVTADRREGIDFFPLQVEYFEKLYASGQISSSRFIKRETRPSTDEILRARLIDRSIRPLFNEDFVNQVEVVVTVLSYDGVNDPALLGINAVSTALCLSGLPFSGPVAGIRIGFKDDKFIVNPSTDEIETSEMDLVVATTKSAIVMLEAGATEIQQSKVIEAIKLAKQESKNFLDFQEELKKEVNPETIMYSPKLINTQLVEEIKSKFYDRVSDCLFSKSKKEFNRKEKELKDELLGIFVDCDGEEFRNAFIEVEKYIFTEEVVKRKERIDGRKLNEIRPITVEVSILPRTHGSAIFKRGETQALSVVTLGSSKFEQLMQSKDGEKTSRYMHHYNHPGWSVGEVSRNLYFPGRREIGHGALAQRALEPVIPSEEEFPYTIRVVSEILSSNGSTSMASTCGSTLSLMDAGVPIKAMVSGIAMGLVMNKNGEYVVLSDIQGAEDHFGEMDFKVTGTEKGITAIQMDNKMEGITVEILDEAINQAREGYLFILERMKEVISKPKQSLSQYAPKIRTVKVPITKIGDVIGSQGKTIKKIIELTGAEVDISDNGVVSISSIDDEAGEKASKMIENIIMEPEVGKTYKAKVEKIMDFGAFVRVSPSISGLVHVSEIKDGFIKSVKDALKEGQSVEVILMSIDNDHRLNFSIKKAAKKSIE